MNDPSKSTLPEHIFRFCPGCGSSEFHFRQDNSFLCGQCGFVFFINAAAAVAALIEDSSGRLLLTRRAKEPMKGKLDLPGGFVDPGESAEQALEREITEELNLDIDKKTFFVSQPNTYEYAGITYFTLDLAFLCRILSFDGMHTDEEIDGVEFLFPDEIDLDEIGLASIRKIVSLYLTSKKAP
ncbi:MAG TPA: NUDIX domain-containing protein [Deltaproteobacteria bacterium]|nr:NUDIX domain-containing protein [Deltaproteobacteria bacterium]